MKIAICFSGQTRTSTYAAPNIKRFIGDLWDQCDFYIHTWDIEQLRSKHWGPTAFAQRPVSQVPVTRFEELKQIYNPCKFEIENYNDCLTKIANEHGNTIHGNNWIPLYYSWYKSMLLATENQSYDVIVKLRTDIVFPSYKNLQDTINQFNLDKEMFLVDNLTDIRIDDVYWVANSENMLKASNYWIYLLDYHNKHSKKIEFIEYIKMLDIKYRKINSTGYSILREECRHLNPLNFKECYDCEQIYYGSEVPYIWTGKD